MSTKDRAEIEIVKARLNLSEIIKQYVSLKEISKGVYLGTCPFHQETNPSFRVNDEERFFYCFGCQASGDIFDFYGRINGLSFAETIKDLKQLVGLESKISTPNQNPINLDYNLNSPNIEIYLYLMQETQNFFLEELGSNTSKEANQAREYLKRREISNDLISKIGIGFAPNNQVIIKRLIEQLKNKKIYGSRALKTLIECGLINQKGYSFFQSRLTFPIATMQNQILGFNARVTNEKTENKYKNSPRNIIFSKRHILYGLENIDIETIREKGLVLVEGITDTFGFVKQNLNNALVLGSAKLTPQQISIINYLNPKQVYIIPDNDTPGKQGAISNANKLLGSPVSINGQASTQDNVLIVPINKKDSDPFDLFVTDGENIIRYCQKHSYSPLEFFELQNINSFNKQFLIDNTDKIIERDRLNELNSALPGYQDRNQTKIELEIPHPLIIR